MKNFKLIAIIFFCTISIKTKAQVFQWQKIVESEKIINNQIPTDNSVIVKKTNDNNIIVVFNHKRNALESLLKKHSRYDSVVISKFNLDGNLIWQRRYALPGSGAIEDINSSHDGGYITCGSSGANNFYYKLNSTGNILSFKNFPNSANNFFFKKIVENENGNYTIASLKFTFKTKQYSEYSTSYSYDYNIDFYVGAIDNNGNILSNNKIAYKSASFYNMFFDIQINDYENLEPSVKYQFNAIEIDSEQLTSLMLLHDDTIINGQYFSMFHFNNTGNAIYQKFNVITDTNNIFGNYISFFTQNKSSVLYQKHHSENNPYRNISELFLTDNKGEQIKTAFDSVLLATIITDGSIGKITSVQNIDSCHYMCFSLFSRNDVDENVAIVKIDKNLKFQWIEKYKIPNLMNNKILSISETLDNNILIVTQGMILNPVSTNYEKFELRFTKISSNANQLNFNVFIDVNNNSSYDSDDTIFSNALVEISNGSNTNSYPIKANGTLIKFVMNGNYTSKLIDYNQRLKYYDVSPSIKVSNFFSLNITDSITFRLTPKPNIQDLQVSIVPITIARPGFNSSYKIIAKNVGTKMMFLPIVKFIKDSLQTFTDSTTYVLDNDTLLWQIDSLSLLEQREIVVSVLNAIPPTLNANDTLHLAAIIYPFENDSFVQDNYASLNQVVRNSVDPNDKIETHGGTIPYSAVQNRDYLYYTIRFQNTGNSYATRIVITDTLTENVDASTFEFLSSSVPFVMNVVDRKHITWTAANTYLPDSIADEANSHGYISFRIKPKAGLLPSDEITNRASIVFDYNAAILTNTCITNIIEQRILTVKNNEIKSIHLFPNPTNGNVQLNMNLLQNKNYTLRIIDINGNLLLIENLKGNAGKNNVSIDLSTYANGLYFIQVSDETGNLFYGKVVKQ